MVSAGILNWAALSFKSRTREGKTVSNRFRWSSFAGYLVSMTGRVQRFLRFKEREQKDRFGDLDGSRGTLFLEAHIR